MNIHALCYSRVPSQRREPPEIWASKHVRMARSTDAKNYRPDFTPWFTKPMRDSFDNRNREMCITGPTGMGKSGFVEALTCCAQDRAPGPIMIIAQTDDDAKDWAETGLWPALRSCEPLRQSLPSARGSWLKDKLLREGAPIHITGANVSGTQSKSELWVIGDEAWLYDAGRMRDIRARLHRRWNGRAVFVSQAGFLVEDEDGNVIGDDFTKACDQGEQWEWCFSCPQCKSVQPYQHQQLVMPDEGTTAERALACVYECSNCKTAFDDTPKSRRQFVDRSAYESMREARIPGHHHFHLNYLALFRAPWSEGALDFLNSAHAMKQGSSLDLQQFTQKQLAEPWREELSIVRGNLDLVEETMSDFANGEELDGEAKRGLMVDTQRDHFWVLPRLFRGDGSSVGIGYYKVNVEESIEEMRLKLNIPPNQVYIDSSYDPGRVYDICAKYGWIAIKGSKQQSYDWAPRGKRDKKVAKLYSRTKNVRAPCGKNVRVMFLATNPLKDILTRLRSGEGARWQQVSDIGQLYEKHLDSEERREFLNARTNQPSIDYVKLRHDNHAWDLEYYAVAFGLVWGLFSE